MRSPGVVFFQTILKTNFISSLFILINCINYVFICCDFAYYLLYHAINKLFLHFNQTNLLAGIMKPEGTLPPGLSMPCHTILGKCLPINILINTILLYEKVEFIIDHLHHSQETTQLDTSRTDAE